MINFTGEVSIYSEKEIGEVKAKRDNEKKLSFEIGGTSNLNMKAVQPTTEIKKVRLAKDRLLLFVIKEDDTKATLSDNNIYCKFHSKARKAIEYIQISNDNRIKGFISNTKLSNMVNKINYYKRKQR